MLKVKVLLFILLLASFVRAQTSLDSGDIAFIAINSDGSADDFSFVLLNSIESGTVIYFTDNGWTASGEFNAIYTESHFSWTADNQMEPGTIVHIETYNGTALPQASDGTIIGKEMTISVAGDQIFAYQGDKMNPVFITAISFNQNSTSEPGTAFDEDSFSNSTTALPENLTMGLNAIHVYAESNYREQDNAIYNCTVTSGTKSELLAAINDKSNWLMDNDNPFEQYPFACDFQVGITTEEISLDETSVQVTPNPVTDYLQLQIGVSNSVEVHVFSATGEIIDEFIYDSLGGFQLYNMSHLASGIYYFEIMDNSQEKAIKVIKK